MIDDLCSRYPNLGVACLYADYNDQSNQTLVNILGSFLRQFLTTTREPPIPDEVIQELYDIKCKGGRVSAEENIALLKIRLHQLKHAFICVDAVDELAPKVRQQLLAALQELSSNNTRIFLTGRDSIKTEVEKCFQVLSGYTVTISARPQDIEEFVRQQITEDCDQNPELMDEVLARNIIDAIITKSQGM